MRSHPPGRWILPAALAGAFLMTAPALAPAAEPASGEITKVTTVNGITEYRLKNGLRLLLFPDPSKPIVTVNMTVFVGSRHEGYGETGMAHLLEHMLFKGTPTFPNVPKALRDHGAGNRFNGTTWVDRTNYYETLPATDENLEFAIKLESDRMVNSFVKREDLVSEMTVVRNEFEAGENSPERILAQRMMAVAFEWHNYGKSTIGNRSDIERVPIESLQAFYRKYYQPDNAMLVIAGKFDEKKALDYVAKYFGAIKKPTRDLPNTYTEEPAQDGERRVMLRRVGSVALAGVVYHIPAGAHPDFPPIEVLSRILVARPSGRLYKELVVNKKLASSVSGVAFSWHDPGAMQIIAKTEDPTKLDALRDALTQALEDLHTTKITDEEVERAKRELETDYDDTIAKSDELAVELSDWAAKGDWRLFFLNHDRVQKVTPADVQRVAGKYLVRNNRTVGMFVPTKDAQRADIPETPNVAAMVKDYKGTGSIAVGEAFEPTPENIEKRTSLGKIEGVSTALLPKKTRGELVHVRMNLRFGNAQALRGQNAAAELLGPMMRRGTKKHSRQQLQDELDKLGTQLSVSSDVGVLSVTIQTKKASLPATLKLVQEILREPTFPAEEFEILKRETRERLVRAKTEPTALASQALQRKLTHYDKDDVRYVPTIEEEIGRLDALKVEQIVSLYETQLGSQAGELAIIGDFDAEGAQKLFREMLKDWRSKVVYERIERPARTDLKGGKETILTPDKANAVYLAGVPFPLTDTDPDYAALQVGNYLLGGAPLASRLSIRVRGEEGLSYGIGSGVRADARDKSARFSVFAITNPKNIGKVEKAIGEELEKFYSKGVSLAELTEGKRAFAEQMKVQRAEDATLAAQWTNALFAGRTYGYYAELEKRIAALSPGDVSDAFKKHVPISKLVIVEAGDFNKK